MRIQLWPFTPVVPKILAGVAKNFGRLDFLATVYADIADRNRTRTPEMLQATRLPLQEEMKVARSLNHE